MLGKSSIWVCSDDLDTSFARRNKLPCGDAHQAMEAQAIRYFLSRQCVDAFMVPLVAGCLPAVYICAGCVLRVQVSLNEDS